MTLRIYLCGQFKILADDNNIELPSRPAQSLLAYLALTAGTIHRREVLASMLWPETTEANARSYLRQALWRIRKTFEEHALIWEDYLHITDLHASFKRNADYWLDANLLLRPAETESIDSIIETVQHYMGELLPGFYDEWILPERDRFLAAFHQQMNALLEKLIQTESWPEAVRWSEHWIRQGYAPEPAFRALMRAYASMGDRGMLSATYQRCEKALDQELGIEPSRETRLLFRQLCTEPVHPRSLKTGSIPQAATQPRDLFTGEPPIPFEQPTFVARERELDSVLNQVLACEGQIVFITGDAGSGKTALIHEFTRQAQTTHPALIVASGNCNAQTGIGDPYLPFREILEMLTGDIKARWDAGAISRPQAQALWNNLPVTAKALTQNGIDLIDTFIPGAALFERVRHSDSGSGDWYHQLEDLITLRRTSPHLQNPPQSTFFEQYTKVLHETSQEVPMILVVDDLQWADLGSISLLFHLSRQLTGSRIFVIGAYRTEEVLIGRHGERHPLVPVIRELQRIYGDIMIDMEQTERQAFLDAFLDTEPNKLDHEFRQMLYRQTRGHPLFMIELLRGLQDRGDLVRDNNGCWKEGTRLDWDTFPARVEAVITERIDRLQPSLQKALHIASVEGDVFTAEVVAQVQDINTTDLLNQLSNDLDRKHRLVKAQTIQRVNGQLLSSYRFQHIQFQKYLYNSLDQVERVHLHEQIGLILENLYEVKPIPENLADLSTSVTPIVQLAHHFQEARNIPKAINYLHLAGERAVQLSAYQDAFTHLQKGLELIDTLPKNPETSQKELTLLLALTKALKGVEGMAPPEVETVLNRAQAIGQQVGNPSQLCLLMSELAIVYYVRAEHLRAKELAQETLRLSKATDDPVLIAIGHWELGFIQFALGEFAAARQNLRHIISGFDPVEYHNQFIYLKGTNTVLSALAYDSCCLWCLGYRDQANAQSKKAFQLANQYYHPFTMADVVTFGGCLLDELNGDAVSLQEHAEALIKLSERVGIGWHGAGWKHRGAALVMMGQFEAGIADFHKGMREEFVRAARCIESGGHGTLAYAKAIAGEFMAGLTAIKEAISLAELRNEFYNLAELYRIMAEIYLLQADNLNAETSYLRAIEISRQQQAKSWEIRAALGLAKLWQTQGKAEKAKKLLQPVYDWFTEGFDSADLIQAKELLDHI
jgi:DNA-binding SARP family transcriptional activator/tetratricopeptide (TPR) repeat protein